MCVCVPVCLSVLFFPVLYCPVLSCTVLSCPALSRPVPSRPVLSCPILSHPIPSCPVLSCPDCLTFEMRLARYAAKAFRYSFLAFSVFFLYTCREQKAGGHVIRAMTNTITETSQATDDNNRDMISHDK